MNQVDILSGLIVEIDEPLSRRYENPGGVVPLTAADGVRVEGGSAGNQHTGRLKPLQP